MKKIIITAILILSTFTCICQSINFDLSKSPGLLFEQTADEFSLKEIILKNKIIGKDILYTINIAIEDLDPAPIKTDLFDLSKVFPAPVAAAAPGKCDALSTAYKKLEAETDEKNVPDLIKKIDEELAKLQPNDCPDHRIAASFCKARTTSAEPLIVPIKLSKGKKITITVTRGEKKWYVVIKSQQSKKVVVFYGLTYGCNMMNPIQTFFSKQDTGSTFIITKNGNKRSDFVTNLSPSVLFTYRAANTFNFKVDGLKALVSNEVYKLGITAGVGIDLKNPSVFISPSLIFGDMLTLNLGVGFLSKDVLKGKFNEGDRINENLDFDQLHEKKFNADWFLSLGLRLDEKIFKKDSEKKEKD